MRRTASVLVAIVLVLLSIGVVMLASTSSVKGVADYGDAHYFLKRQLLWLAISIVCGAVVVRFDYHWWQKIAPALVAVSFVLLVLVVASPLGQRVGGSSRWIRLGPVGFQPSELAKFSMIVGLAAWMARVGRKAGDFLAGFLYPLAGLGAMLVLLMLEPDFGTTLLVGTVGMIIMFAAGTRPGYLAIAGVLGGSAFALAVMNDPVRMRRILAFLMPDKHPDIAYHLSQSKVAFVRGGALGVGLGNSLQKQFYLPEAHTDFIFAIIGEELGFAGTGLVLLLYIGLTICGLIISFNALDNFGKLTGYGITMLIALQSAINVGVVIGCLPTKGLPLPFVSYGGSSLLMAVVSICVLLNIANHVYRRRQDEHTEPIKDRTHWF
jgi:cell division protein FtsW